MQGRELGSWWHLFRRFIEVATARRLSESERTFVDSLLDNRAEGSLFFGQARADRRHAFRAAHKMSLLAPGRRDLARAALLHDVGKRHARLGIVGRSVASALAKLRLRPSGRLAVYLDHGRLGAIDLDGAGCEAVVTGFAHHHHEIRPDSISRADWALLELADSPGKAPDTPPAAIR
ncbi:MAG: hypothetical protein HKN95_08220 [Acidimicrobiia bacterium]|nr:hypothetical protein [Acidimicrobiia bacterium]